VAPTLLSCPEPVEHMVFNPTGSLLAAAVTDGTAVRLWELPTHRSIPGPTNLPPISSIAFGSDRDLLILAPHECRSYDTATNTSRSIWADLGTSALALALSPHAETLALACGRTVRLIRVSDGNSMHLLSSTLALFAGS
jgi:WD40 repeat protein